MIPAACRSIGVSAGGDVIAATRNRSGQTAPSPELSQVVDDALGIWRVHELVYGRAHLQIADAAPDPAAGQSHQAVPGSRAASKTGCVADQAPTHIFLLSHFRSSHSKTPPAANRRPRPVGIIDRILTNHN